MMIGTGNLRCAAVALVLGLFATGCERNSGADGEHERSEVAQLRLELRAVDGEQSLRELAARADAFLERATREGAPLSFCEEAVELALSAAHFDGNFSRVEAVESCIARHEEHPVSAARVTELRMQWLQAVHRFDAVRTMAAERLDDDARLRWMAALEVATNADEAPNHRIDEVVAARRERALRYPSYEAWTRVAAAERARGQYDEADAAFRAALDVYRDVSPFAMAWIQFQRGVLWGEHADDPIAARALYEDAVRYVPGYVVANVHLSELEAEAGDLDAAIERLEGLVEQTEDPEPHSRLAEYYAQAGDEAAARRHAREAERGYRAWLERFPEAFADHASEFFAGVGDDASYARELTAVNLQQRKTARAYMQAIAANLAVDELSTACDLVARVSPATQHTGLRETLEQARRRCSQQARNAVYDGEPR